MCAGSHRAQKRVADPLELELTDSCELSDRVLGAKLRSSVRAASAGTHAAISLSPAQGKV